MEKSQYSQAVRDLFCFHIKANGYSEKEIVSEVVATLFPEGYSEEAAELSDDLSDKLSPILYRRKKDGSRAITLENSENIRQSLEVYLKIKEPSRFKYLLLIRETLYEAKALNEPDNLYAESHGLPFSKEWWLINKEANFTAKPKFAMELERNENKTIVLDKIYIQPPVFCESLAGSFQPYMLTLLYMFEGDTYSEPFNISSESYYSSYLGLVCSVSDQCMRFTGIDIPSVYISKFLVASDGLHLKFMRKLPELHDCISLGEGQSFPYLKKQNISVASRDFEIKATEDAACTNEEIRGS